MQKSLVPFAFEDSLVRVIMDEGGQPWFVAKDVAKALEYNWNGAACVAHVPEEWRGVRSVLTPGGEQDMLCLSEQGLYFFLARSDKPAALPFQKWLAGDVLPALRQTGSYVLPSAAPLPAAVHFLKPMLRERVLASALQAARLIGLSSREEIDALYHHYCALVAAAPPEVESGDGGPVQTWARTHLTANLKGNGIQCAKLYAVFCDWFSDQGHNDLPSLRYFSSTMATLFDKYKTNKVYYRVRWAAS